MHLSCIVGIPFLGIYPREKIHRNYIAAIFAINFLESNPNVHHWHVNEKNVVYPYTEILITNKNESTQHGWISKDAYRVTETKPKKKCTQCIDQVCKPPDNSI